MMEAKHDVVPRVGNYQEVDRSMPKGYSPCLNPKDTQRAMRVIHQTVENGLCKELNLFQTGCPIIMEKNTGFNDMLYRDGMRKPVEFQAGLGIKKQMAIEIVQSCAKWKRFALKQFGCEANEGILTEVTGIRKDYFMDNEHSVCVHHWDWERVMQTRDRNLDFLKTHVNKVWKVICEADNAVRRQFPALSDPSKFPKCSDKIHFIHAEELLERYPKMTRTQREREISKELQAVFIIGIGYPLADGNPHMLRAADHEDWITETVEMKGKKCHGLNGDIFVWNPVTQRQTRLGSMGIRVNKDTLTQQLKESKLDQLANMRYHQMVMQDQLPQSIGGGIGEGRLNMFLLRKMAIGECDIAVWPREYQEMCKKHNIPLLQ